MAYGSRWRARRKLFHEALNEKMSGSYDGHQHKHVYRFLSRLLEEPGSFTQEVDLCVVSRPFHPVRLLTYHPTP